MVVLALLPLTGCTTLSPEGAFSEVADTPLGFGSANRCWDAGQYEDPLVRSAIDKLLSRPLTADTAVQIALLNNRELQAIYTDLGVAQVFPVAGGAPDYTFDIALKFIDIVYIPLRKRVPESQLEEAKFQVTAQVMSAAQQTYEAFIDYLGQRQTAGVLTQALTSAIAVVEAGKALRQAGNITDYDFEIEVAQQVQIAAELARAQTAVPQARERANRLMGLSGSQTRWRSADLYRIK